MYKINNSKLENVVRIFNNETHPAADSTTIKKQITADWNEGEEHQEWLDAAEPQEIADWLASFQ